MSNERTIRLPLKLAVVASGRPAYLVAAEARIHPNVLAAITTGRIDPTPEVRARLARVLGRPEAELFLNRAGAVR